MSQTLAFLEGEGDAWFRRNLLSTEPSERVDLVEEIIVRCAGGLLVDLNLPICEVGSSRGDRVFRLSRELGLPGIAIDPSDEALRAGQSYYGKALTFIRGTSDSLACKDQSLGLVFFGFCLYLTPPHEFKESLREAHRTLHSGGVLAVFDFDSEIESSTPYKHLDNVVSYRRDYTGEIMAESRFGLLAKVPLSREQEFGLDSDPDERTAVWIFQKS